MIKQFINYLKEEKLKKKQEKLKIQNIEKYYKKNYKM